MVNWKVRPSFLLGPQSLEQSCIFSSSGFRGHETFNSKSFQPRCIIFAPGVGGSGSGVSARVQARLIVSVVYIWQQNDRYFYSSGKMINNLYANWQRSKSYTPITRYNSAVK